MPYLPPRLFETPYSVSYPHVVHYNGYGATDQSGMFDQLPNESDVAYAQRLMRDWVPSVAELVAGKPAVEQVAILTAKMESMQKQGVLTWPIVGPMFFQPRYDEYAKRVEALQPIAAAEQELQSGKTTFYKVSAAAAILGGILTVGYLGLRFYYLVRANESSRQVSRISSEKDVMRDKMRERQAVRTLNPRRRRSRRR